jgi:hypothetical protein
MWCFKLNNFELMRFCCGKILEITFITSSQHSCVVLEPSTDTASAIYIYTHFLSHIHIIHNSSGHCYILHIYIHTRQCGVCAIYLANWHHRLFLQQRQECFLKVIIIELSVSSTGDTHYHKYQKF